MSGCSYETFSLCRHGVPGKMGCLACAEYEALEERIKKLEDAFINQEVRSIAALTAFQNKIEKLEGYLEMEDRITTNDILFRFVSAEERLKILEDERDKGIERLKVLEFKMKIVFDTLQSFNYRF